MRKAAKVAISAAAVLVVFGVFVGVGTNQQAEERTEYKRTLEESVSSKSTSSESSATGEQTNYQKTLEESVSSESSSPPQPPVQPTPKENNCDPSYPTVCIPPYPPDLNCKDIPYSNFQVFQPDPHEFDADKDGIGCEPE